MTGPGKRQELGKASTSGIIVHNRMRPLDEAKVKALAESMQAVGLQNPIHAWKASDNEVILVAGHHRLAAAKQLNDLKRAWQKANDDARQMFNGWLVKAAS